MPVGAPVVRGGAAHRRRDLPHPARHPEEEGARHRRRRRGGIRAQPVVEPGGGRSRARSRRAGRLQGRATTCSSRSTSPRASSGTSRRAATSSRSPARQTRTADEMVALYEDWVRQYPIISIEDGVAEGDWDGWRAMTRALGERVQLVGDDLFVTNTEILAKRDQRGRRQLDPDQAESDRNGQRNARRDRHGHGRRLLPASSRTGPARPRTRRSRTSRSRPRPARSRPARRAAATAWRNTTSCCASRKSSARRAARYAGQQPRSRSSCVRTQLIDAVPARSASPRRKHVEQGKPVHRMDRRRSLRARPRRSPRRPAVC